jgi:hypothetical protein
MTPHTAIEVIEGEDESTDEDARIEYDADLQRDDAMLDQARVRMDAHWLDRVMSS